MSGNPANRALGQFHSSTGGLKVWGSALLRFDSLGFNPAISCTGHFLSHE
jgi:hypothetical protein